jgi:hypothetical protein
MDTPPKHFEHLTALVEGPASLDQAVALTQALKSVPDAQAWLRQERQRIVLELHAAGMSYTDMAPALDVKPERVSGIARGHSRSGGRRAADGEG